MKKKNILSAIISFLIIVSPFTYILLLMINLFTNYQNEKDVTFLLFIFIEVIFLGMVLICAIKNLIIRIKEIKGGEENEASKY